MAGCQASCASGFSLLTSLAVAMAAPAGCSRVLAFFSVSAGDELNCHTQLPQHPSGHRGEAFWYFPCSLKWDASVVGGFKVINKELRAQRDFAATAVICSQLYALACTSCME